MSAINLAQINAWLDVIFPVLEVLIIGGLTLHFVAGVLVGRFRDTFVEGHWMKHDHEIPPQPKIHHAVNLAMFVLLIFSGLYIRYPFFSGGREAMRWVHYVAMTVVIVNWSIRFGYAFLAKERDYKEFATRMVDLKAIPGTLKFYGYMSKVKPHVAKYNPLQKQLYLALAIMIPIQAITGISLLTQKFVMGYSPRYLLTFWWAPAVGGIATAGAIMRLVHFTFNWLFILMVSMHFYMAWSQDMPGLVDFFGGKWRGPGSDAWKEKRRAAGKPTPKQQPDVAAQSEAH